MAKKNTKKESVEKTVTNEKNEKDAVIKKENKGTPPPTPFQFKDDKERDEFLKDQKKGQPFKH